MAGDGVAYAPVASGSQPCYPHTSWEDIETFYPQGASVFVMGTMIRITRSPAFNLDGFADFLYALMDGVTPIS